MILEYLRPILQALIYAALVGGGLWKGLEAFGKLVEAVANALKLRAEIEFERRRLEDEQIRNNYHAALALSETQGKALEALSQRLADYEANCRLREEELYKKIDRLSGKVDKLETENGELTIKYQAIKLENGALLGEIGELKSKNESLRGRIRALENGDKKHEASTSR